MKRSQRSARIFTTILTLALALLGGSATATQLPTVFTYQGYLTFSGGIPASGCYDIEVDLYDASSGGTLLGSQSFVAVNVVAGYFNLGLNFGSVFTGGILHLEIRYRPCGTASWTTLSPRQPLTATPNAMYASHACSADTAGHATTADDADTLDGFDSTDFLVASGGGDVGIGTPAPSCRLHVTDVLTANQEAAVCVDFATTTDSILTLGVNVVGATMPSKGTQYGVRAETSINGYAPPVGRATGVLGTSSAWFYNGAFHGVSGAAHVDTLDNWPDPVAVSRGLGGHFYGAPDASGSLDLDGDGTYYFGGAYGEVNGEVNGPNVCTNAVAGIIGVDNNTGTAPSFAGHFTGDGYFSGSVGIGTCDVTHVLTLGLGRGDAIADGWVTHSSRRFKTQIATLDGALDRVRRLRGVSYEDNVGGGEREIGLIAEEVGEVVPEVVSWENNGVDALGVDYSRLVPLLVEAVKQQQAQIEALEARLADADDLR